MNKPDHFAVTAGWLPDQPQIGTCYIDSARGTEVFSFEYERSWISRYPDLFLDPDLQPMPGRQYVPKGKSCFGFLSDAAPDRRGTFPDFLLSRHSRLILLSSRYQVAAL